MPIAHKLLGLALAAVGFSSPAMAFDCAKAETKIEKAICASPQLLEQDKALSNVYAETRSFSDEAERKMLALSQKDWIGGREDACGDGVGADLESCISDETAARLEVFAAKPGSGPGTGTRMMPVFVTQAGAPGVYEIDDILYRFAEPKSAGEKLFNQVIKKIFDAAPLGPHDDLKTVEFLDSTSQVSISYASPRLISALHVYGGDDGGAHPSGGTENINIDLQSGQEIEIGKVFSEKAAATLARQCRDQIIQQKQENSDGDTYDPAKDDFLKDDVIAEHIATMSRWTFNDSAATVTFDPYAIGPYVEGEYSCSFDNADLKSLALPNAPLP